MKASEAIDKNSPKVQTLVMNPYLTNGFFHHYQLGEFTFIFRGVRSDFYFFIAFFYENSLSKQNGPRWDSLSAHHIWGYAVCLSHKKYARLIRVK